MSAERCRRALPAVLLLAVFLLSLCFQVTQPGFIPGETFANLYTGVRLFFADLFQLPLALDRWDLIDAHPYYYETFVRLKSSLTTALSGMGICLAGAVFQTVFRNPLASPNIVGVSAGVNLGKLVLNEDAPLPCTPPISWGCRQGSTWATWCSSSPFKLLPCPA